MLGKVLNVVRLGFLIELFSSGNGVIGEIVNKWVRCENSLVCGDGE